MEEASIPPDDHIPMKRVVVRCSLILCPVILVVSALSFCDCPGFFVVMGVLTLPALFWGSQLQRAVGIAFAIVAVMGFIYQSQAGKERAEKLRKLQSAPREMQVDPQRPS